MWSDAGGEFDVPGVDVTLDDDAPKPLPDSAQIVSGTYRPANYGTGDNWPAPAPRPLSGSALSIFNGPTPTGRGACTSLTTQVAMAAWSETAGS
jgi:hypothetical protein